MVSSSNIAIVGLALLFGFFVLRGSNNQPPISPDSQAPQAFTIIQDPAQTKALPEFLENLRIRQEQIASIPFLENLLSNVQQFFRQNFPPTQVIRDPVTGGKCRGPNCLGVLGASGVRLSIDPFTGRRVIIPFGERASPKTRSFFSSGQGSIFGDPGQNLLRITQGNIIKGQFTDFIDNIKDQLKIFRTLNNGSV